MATIELETKSEVLRRIDVSEKVAGKLRYTTDMIEVEALYVKVVRSAMPHAMIESIDISQAKETPGVIRVITSHDVPGENLIGFFTRDQPLLAEDRVRFIGEAVALVVAENPVSAMTAVNSVKISYKPLPAILDIDSALSPDAIKIHEDGNIKESFVIKKGNVESAFEKSDIVIEGRYSFPYQEHAYLETEACLAMPTEGGITVIGSMQVPFAVERAVRTVLGNAVNKVRVIQAPTGGGFGGKEDAPDEVCAHAALAAYLTGRPALLAYNRKESIIFHPKRHPGYIKRKLGATRDGILTALSETIMLDGGAYMSLTPRVIFQSVATATGPYLIPNVDIEGKGVYTNKVPCGAFRGFGKPQSQFAAELQMDELAKELKMDPLELRLKNLIKEGSELPWGQRLGDGIGILQCAIRVKEMAEWEEKRQKYGVVDSKGIARGIGLALAMHGTSIGPLGIDVGSAIIELDENGKIVVKNSLTEYGQGIYTGWIEIVSRALNVDKGLIEVIYPDTSIMYDSGPTVASRSTAVGGRAIYEAAINFKSAILKAASQMIGVKPHRLSLEGDSIKSIENPNNRLSLKDIASMARKNGQTIKGEAWVNMNQGSYWDREKGRGVPWKSYSFAAHVAEVEVDINSGKVNVVNYYAVHDSGKILKRSLAESQVYGGVVQGLGYALMEDLHFKDGKLLSNSFLDYMIPTFADTPNIYVDFIETYNEDGPFGAKGLGEVPIEPVAPAIANAIYNAIGKPIRAFPFTSERVFSALQGD
ncbi:MAG: xanthine dehydrogenase family protein molybdopterin-binding subunit [Conexivisphaerales archaeon]